MVTNMIPIAVCNCSIQRMSPGHTLGGGEWWSNTTVETIAVWMWLVGFVSVDIINNSIFSEGQLTYTSIASVVVTAMVSI